MLRAKTIYPDLIFSSLVSLLILLWSYTALSKLIAFRIFASQMENQNFGTLAAPITWLVPITEVAVSLLLLFKATRLIGLWLSLLLILTFTGYIGLVLIGYFDKVPCSCGGVLQQLSWHAHLWFNLFFVAVNLLAINYAKMIASQHKK